MVEKEEFSFKRNPEYLFSGLVLAIFITLDLLSDSTGDSGDSISHYLFAKYAPRYPRLYLDHWGKPFFTLLASPFAQFGFKGIKIFNALCIALISLFSYKTARILGYKYAWFSYLVFLFSPVFFQQSQSGLTEYLFGAMLIISIYLVLKEQLFSSLVIVSLLPLTRSEGLIVICVFILYLLFNKRYKYIPVLLTGQVFYSIAGAFYYKDILWVFNRIPYATTSGRYGNGKWFDMFDRLNFVIEMPLFGLTILSTMILLFGFFRSPLEKLKSVKFTLVLGVFIAIFTGHAVFWHFGIFHSMGLPRVFIVVVPLVAVLVLEPINMVAGIMPRFKSNIIVPIVAGLVVIGFPFYWRSMGLIYNREIFREYDCEFIQAEIVPWVKENYPNYNSRTLYFTHRYFCIGLGIDFFDDSKHRELSRLYSEYPKDSSLVIWDNWYGVVENNINTDFFTEDKYSLQKTFSKELWDRTIEYRIYEPK